MTGKKEASQPVLAKRAQGVAGLPMQLQEGLPGAGGRLLRLVLNGFYSVAGLLRSFAFLTLARVRNARSPRTHAPGEWGILLGLDRCPEVKILRRTLYRFAGCVGAIPAWQDALARQWMAADPAACATLAVDGHVKVYAGRKGKLLSRCKRFKPGGGAGVTAVPRGPREWSNTGSFQSSGPISRARFGTLLRPGDVGHTCRAA